MLLKKDIKHTIGITSSASMIIGTLGPGLEVAISISIPLSASGLRQVYLLQLAMDTDLCHKHSIIHQFLLTIPKQKNMGNTNTQVSKIWK